MAAYGGQFSHPLGACVNSSYLEWQVKWQIFGMTIIWNDTYLEWGTHNVFSQIVSTESVKCVKI